MIVRIDKNVHVQIAEFYAISMALHPTLDEVTVEKKKSRLFDAIRALENNDCCLDRYCLPSDSVISPIRFCLVSVSLV